MKKDPKPRKNQEDQKQKNKIGAPSKYSKQIGDEICKTIATTKHGLRKLCKDNPHWPNKKTIYEWAFDNSEFRDQYARAKAFQIEWLVESALEIAEDGSNDTYVDDNGNERCNNEWIARSRLRVDTIKWLSSKLAPKIYGDKLETNQNVTINDKVSRMKNSVKVYEKE